MTTVILDQQNLNVASSTWNLVDVSRLDPAHGALATKQRREIYEGITQRFRIHEDGTISGDIKDPKFASKISKFKYDWHEWLEMFLFHGFVFLYFMPMVIFVISLWFFFSYGMWKWMLFSCLLGAIIEFYPPSLWRGFFHTTWNYVQYNYFSYRFAYHSSVKDYISHQVMGTPGHPPMIIISIPHAIFPFGTMMSPLIFRDCFNKAWIGTMASVLGYLPVLRTMLYWVGTISATKSTIVNALEKGHNVHIVPDGIAGMFVQSEDTENVRLKKRKGVAKLSLQTGCPVVPAYGFGNTSLFKLHTDPFGIMERISRKLKMSIIFFSGRYGSLCPPRVPLYYVIGPAIEMPNGGKPVPNPSQEQIDEYHERILLSFKTLFDAHKSFYGWEDKELQFI